MQVQAALALQLRTSCGVKMRSYGEPCVPSACRYPASAPRTPWEGAGPTKSSAALPPAIEPWAAAAARSAVHARVPSTAGLGDAGGPAASGAGPGGGSMLAAMEGELLLSTASLAGRRRSCQAHIADFDTLCVLKRLNDEEGLNPHVAPAPGGCRRGGPAPAARLTAL